MIVTLLLTLVAVFILYQILKPKTPKVTSFDEYLIKRHKESEERAKNIIIDDGKIHRTSDPGIVTTEELKRMTLPWYSDMYLGMIKSNSDRYDIQALRLEACQALKITEEYLDELLKNYKKT